MKYPPRKKNQHVQKEAKGYKYSGINKCIMYFCAPEIKESHYNLEKIFKLIQIDEVFLKYPIVIFTGDIKFLNEVYRIMAAGARHPFLY